MPSYWRSEDGPPMIPQFHPPRRKKKRRNTKKETPPESFPRYVHPVSLNELQGPDHLVASSLPEGFPPKMAFRALAAYSLLRTLSIELRLSPFTPNVFLRALMLPFPNRLMGQIHVSLLRVLLPALRMGYCYRERGGSLCVFKKRRIGGLRWELRAGDNLTYLDRYTWPLFYDDYVHLTADDIWARMHDDELHADFRHSVFRDAPTVVLPTESIVVPGTASRRPGQMIPTRGRPPTAKKIDQCQPYLAANFQVLVDSDSEAYDSGGSEFGASDVEPDIDEDFAKPLAKRKRRSKKANPSAEQDGGSGSASCVQIPSKQTHTLDAQASVEIFASTYPGLATWAPTPPPGNVRASSLSEQRIAGLRASKLSGKRMAIYSMEMSRDDHPLQHKIQQVLSVGGTRRSGVQTEEPPAKRMKEIVPCRGVATAPGYHPGHNPHSHALGQATLSSPHGTGPLAAPVLPNVGTETAKQSHRPMQVAGQALPSYPNAEVPIASKSPTAAASATRSNNRTPIAGETTLSSPCGTRTITTSLLPNKGKTNGNQSHKPTPIARRVAQLDPHVAGPLAPKLRNYGAVNANQAHKQMQGASQATPSCPHVAGTSCPKPPNGSKLSTTQAHVTAFSVVPAQYSSIPKRPFSAVRAVNHVQNTQYPLPVVAPVVPKWNPIVKVEAPTLPAWKPAPNINAQALSWKNADMLHNYLVGRHKNLESDEKRSSEESTGRVSEGQRQQISGDLKAETSAYESDDTHPFSPDTNEDWPQFAPVEMMRNGLPYHRLQLEQKMRILEFLLDELLTIDFIAAEFTRREVATSCFDYPYGALPTKSELESLENEDECGLCGLEGELLCCDGCIRSYHRQCIGMKGGNLSNDKWLCPECTTIDPCQFGPLRVGRKSSLDWFMLSDVKVCARSGTVNQSAFLETKSITIDSTMGMADNLPGPNLIQHAEIDVIGSNAEAAPTPSVQKDSEFLVVHGFLFSRPLSFHRGIQLQSMDTEENWKDIFRDWLPATRDEIFDIVHGIDSRLSCSWPLNQIPLEPSKVWSSAFEPERSNNFSRYFLLRESFDPSSYCSLYRMAPLPQSLQVGKGSKRLSLVLSDFESECNSSDVRVLSSLLTRDMSQDHRVAIWLNASTQLFNPHQLISLYLVRLEASLRRGCLLDENWSIRKGIYKPEKWPGEVTACSSTQKLAKMMVHLVDACHSRVFLDSWFEVCSDGQGKSDFVSLAESSDPRTYETLPIDWTADVEMACRRWQRALDSNILSLLSGASIRLEGSAKGGKPTLVHQKGRKERKGTTFERQSFSEETRKSQKREPSVADDHDKHLASLDEGSVVAANRQASGSEASASFDGLYATAEIALEECSKQAGALNAVAEPSPFNVETMDANILSISNLTGVVAVRMSGNLSVFSRDSGSKLAAEASNNREGMAIEQVNCSVEYSIPGPIRELATLLVAEKTKSEGECPSQESLQSEPVAEPTHAPEGLENGLAHPSRDSTIALRATVQVAQLTRSEEGCLPKSKSAREQTNNADGPEADEVYISEGYSNATPIAERSNVQFAKRTKSEEGAPSQESPKERTKTPEGLENGHGERSTIQTAEGTGREECPLQQVSKPVAKRTNDTQEMEKDNLNLSQGPSTAGPIEEQATLQVVGGTKRDEGLSSQESHNLQPTVDSAKGLEHNRGKHSQEPLNSSRMPGTATLPCVKGMKREEKGCPSQELPKSTSAAEIAHSEKRLENDQADHYRDISISTPIAERISGETVEGTKVKEGGLSLESPKFEPAERIKALLRNSSMATPVAEISAIQTAEEATREERSSQESSKLKPAAEQANWDGTENDFVNLSTEPSIACPILEQATIQALPDKSSPLTKRPRGRLPKRDAGKLITKTRRSGRLHRTDFSDKIESLSSGPCMASESVDGERVLPWGDKTYTFDQVTRLEHERKTRLAKLEHLIANPTVTRTHWPVAGRKLFDPVGYIPPSEMRRLGRNAGTVVAPYVRYSSSYDVGEVSVYHSWRKRSLNVRSFDDLIMQIRVLASFIDKSVLHSCEALARRSPKVKSQVQKVVDCKQRDLQTGTMCYFVVNKGRRRGYWVDADSIDLSSLVLERSNCINAILKRCDKRVEKEEAQKINEAISVPKAECPPSQPSFAAAGTVTKAEVPSTRRTFALPGAMPRVNCPPSRPTLAECKLKISTAVMQHQTNTEQLIACYKAMGLNEVPISEISKLRSKNALKLKEVYSALHEGRPPPTAEEARILSLLCSAEEQATIRLKKTKARKGTHETKPSSKYGHSLDNSVMAQMPAHFIPPLNTGKPQSLPHKQYVGGASNPHIGSLPWNLGSQSHPQQQALVRNTQQSRVDGSPDLHNDDLPLNPGNQLHPQQQAHGMNTQQSRVDRPPTPHEGNLPPGNQSKSQQQVLGMNTLHLLTVGPPNQHTGNLLPTLGNQSHPQQQALGMNAQQSCMDGLFNPQENNIQTQSGRERGRVGYCRGRGRSDRGDERGGRGSLPPFLGNQSHLQQQAHCIDTPQSRIAMTQTYSSQQMTSQPVFFYQAPFPYQAHFPHHPQGFNAYMQNQLPNRFSAGDLGRNPISESRNEPAGWSSPGASEPGWHTLSSSSNERVCWTSQETGDPGWGPMLASSNASAGSTAQDTYLEPRPLDVMLGWNPTQAASSETSGWNFQDLEPRPFDEMPRWNSTTPAARNGHESWIADMEPRPLEAFQHPDGHYSFGYRDSGNDSNSSTWN